MLLGAVMSAFHAVIDSWKLRISALERVPKFYYKHKLFLGAYKRNLTT